MLDRRIDFRDFLRIAILGGVLLPGACSERPAPPIGSPGSASPEVSEAVEALTGARTRLVWSQHQSRENSDTLLNGSAHRLAVLDTDDGRGVRYLLTEEGNYSRPLITPDGEWILYTEKSFERDGDWKRNWRLEMFAVDWEGGNRRSLGDGYAVDVVEDDEGRLWVYAARDAPDTDRALFNAERIVRFPFDAPEERETVWEGTPVSPDNFQLAGDHRTVAALLPWPAMGIADLATGEWERLAAGCWTSTAPTGDAVAWVLDGSHRILRFFSPDHPEGWSVRLRLGDGTEKTSFYHPRWSNDPRFFAFTGPYHRPEEGGNPITRGGTTAEVLIGKLSSDARTLEDVVPITSNAMGDFYPDLWIEGGETHELATRAPEAEAGLQLPWPPTTGTPAFSWRNAAAKNALHDGDAERICSVEAHGLARFWRDGAMDCRGGSFTVDPSSAEQISTLLSGSADWMIELFLRTSPDTAGRIFQGGNVSLAQEGTQLKFRSADREWQLPLPAERFLLTIRKVGNTVSFHTDGRTLEPTEEIAAKPIPAAEPRFGDGQWEGWIQAAWIAAAPSEPDLADSRMRAEFLQAMAAAAEEVPATRVRATLLEATAVPEVESFREQPYPRALATATWQVDDVLSGDPGLAGQRILVTHWAILDRKPVAFPPVAVGETTLLELEAFEDHPQLASERQFDDSTDYDLEVFHDTGTPGGR